MLNSHTRMNSLSRRWNKRLREIHSEKLKKMRPTISISCPPEFLHLRLRKKQEQLREGKE
jgi:hypothetical protein